MICTKGLKFRGYKYGLVLLLVVFMNLWEFSHSFDAGTTLFICIAQSLSRYKNITCNSSAANCGIPFQGNL